MRVLILGGTSEARQLATALVADPSISVTSSLAGRVRDPLRPPGRVRIGGFGGVTGLCDWLRAESIDVLIDATHPFAATMSQHAAAAAEHCGIALMHLRRPAWTPVAGDQWLSVPDLAGAATAVADADRRVMLTIGRQGVEAFANCQRPWFLLRCIEAPSAALPPRSEILLARGPFALADELRLLGDRRIDVVVSKNSGGRLTEAKLVAARQLGLPVVMVERPRLPAGADVVDSVDAAVAWLTR